MKFYVASFLISTASIQSTSAFGISAKCREARISKLGSTVKRHGPLLAQKSDEEEAKGLEDAFRQLDDLKSLADDPFTVPERKEKQDEAFAKAMQELDLKDIKDTSPAPIESEAELYKDMASEIEGTSEQTLIADLKSDLGGNTIFPQFDPTARDTEKFMEKALDEALAEAEKKSNMEINRESLLDNKEIMKEIEAIFDKGNDKLLEGLEEIRKEQMELAKISAERNAKKSSEQIKEDEQRLAMAESSMKKMLARVNQETKSVELAIEDLKTAQEDTEGGVDSQLLTLKSGGVVKQATLVGTVLFSFRSVVEGVAFMGGDATHLMPAILQGGIALACLAAFLFL